MKGNTISELSKGTTQARWPRLRRSVRSLGVAAAVIVALTPSGLGAGIASAEKTSATPSSGCAATPAAPGSTIEQFAAAGRSGTYIRDVPRDAPGPRPVVLDLHGYMEPAAIAHASSGFGDYGASHGFITVTPQIEEPGLPRWNFQPGSTDIDWIAQLIDHVESTLCVDTRRVFVTGLSMGAFTTSSLGCQLSDRIAAIAPVAGVQDFAWCTTSRPVPVIAFHGTADPIIAYTGGAGPNARLLPAPDGTGSSVGTQREGPAVNGPGPASVPDSMAGWARRNGCETTPARQPVAPDVYRESYPCPADADVELYSIQGGGHVWPGNTSVPFPEIFVGSNTTSINATQLIWDFFEAHPLPE
ncbi:alpha/beta hydrolase family esterase [Nocardia sp. NPDC051750]|uniref:alpha/beta hydrolase family esterase n=1 Tax=Nocardia sp. NPDC051750 TaxID=3364325 RepID=UPI00379C4D39